MKQEDTQDRRVKLAVFLGNPGTRYERTRHNAGRMVVQHAIAHSLTLTPDGAPIPPLSGWKQKFHGRFYRSGETVLLLPDTYMNESGRSVHAAATFFSLPAKSVLLVQDDLETPFGTVALSFGGGHRGNRGVQSVTKHLGNTPVWMLRIGIGRPPANRTPGDWVLERFTPWEEARLPELLGEAVEYIRRTIPAPRDGKQVVFQAA